MKKSSNDKKQKDKDADSAEQAFKSQRGRAARGLLTKPKQNHAGVDAKTGDGSKSLICVVRLPFETVSVNHVAITAR